MFYSEGCSSAHYYTLLAYTRLLQTHIITTLTNITKRHKQPVHTQISAMIRRIITYHGE